MTSTQQFILAIITLIMIFVIVIIGIAAWYGKKNDGSN